MLLVVAYDINTSDKGGESRLRKVSKQCQKYGQRVQDSLFECYIDYSQCMILKGQLEKIIDKNKDSVRMYFLGNKYDDKVIYLGNDKLININKAVIF